MLGNSFGYWLVISFDKYDKHRADRWMCECSIPLGGCGTIKSVDGKRLRKGDSRSCGCKFNGTHNLSSSRTYNIWKLMKDRVLNENADNYHKYGGKGIKVCEKWLKFEGFYEDMGEAPDDMTLDRLNSSKDYTKDNCRWASYKQQNRNRSINRNIDYKGETKCLSEWAELYSISVTTLSSRLKRGWHFEKALLTPIKTRHRRN